MERSTPQAIAFLASSDPQAALTEATRLLPDSVAEDRAVVLQAQGIANRNLRRLELSASQLQQALEATPPGATELGWSIRADLAVTLGDLGEPALGLDHLESFDSGNPGAGQLNVDDAVVAKIRHAKGLLLQRMGRPDEATDYYDAALPLYEQSEQYLRIGQIHINLALLRCYEGETDQALSHLDIADSSFEAVDDKWWMAVSLANRGWALGCSGQLPRALQLLSQADRELSELEMPDGLRIVSKAEVLMRAGLYSTARSELGRAIAHFESRGQATDLGEALVLAAKVAALDDELSDASALAAKASEELRRQNRPGWAAAAQAMEFSLRCRVGEGPPHLTAEVAELCSQLKKAGHRASIPSVILSAAWALIDQGDAPSARALLQEVDEATLSIDDVVLFTLDKAKLARLLDDTETSLAELDAGFLRLEDDLRLLGGLDVAALASDAVIQVVAAAKEILATGSDSQQFLLWSDRGRQIATWKWPRIEDPEIARLLNKARALGPSLDGTPVADDRQNAVAELRRQIRELRWQQHGLAQNSEPGGEVISWADGLVQRDVEMLDLTAVGHRYFVSTVVQPAEQSDRSVVHHPTDIDPAKLTAAVRLGRVFQSSSPMIQLQLIDQLDSVLAPLDAVIAAHLGDDQDAIVLISIDEDLADIPWAALPSLWGRPFSILPTHRYLAERPDRASAKPGVSVMVGPGLATDGAEVDRVAGPPQTPIAVAEVGDFEELTEALDRRIVHIAAHGGPEPDNPLFNWLEFDFGRVFLHDLMFLDAVPEIVVLAACYAGQTQRMGAGGTASFANGFLGVGSRWVVSACTALTDDEDLVGFASDVLGRIISGAEPPVALAQARRAVGDRRANPAAIAFACFGG